ncbi:LLM class flavin-dependent oxidoreductase [Alloyangia pacifica]|uniref:LLM class flavin-dependent oxidoreductase n=1 Tax=Alloyangia pacifica TaxID=311180 RepID=UPI001CD6B8A4|nr:LLM class flavin-dependent oxidoreductase [Alloyangia pacifica]MCA0998004.1 LLM class flavin-dependent oxidoreductase [Alloyangia pacifica]
MTSPRKMKLGLSLRYMGYHMAAWRLPDTPADGATHFEYFLESARKAEAACFDTIFFADGLAVRGTDKPAGALCRDMKNVELEPLTLLSAIAACTKHIGLVATASTSYNEPYHIARKYASLDHISGGRAGWNVVTSWSQQEAHNFNRDEHLSYDERYERAEEFVNVVSGLWDSWDEDAFIRDKDSGIFYDEAGRHVLDHQGRFFKVRGPLTSERTPQGRPLIFQAGASESGRRLGARVADVVYANSLTFEDAKAYYDDMKKRVAAFGRKPSDLAVMPGITLYIGRTQEEAQAKFDALQELIDPVIGLGVLYPFFGDLSQHDPDGPVPAPSANATVRSMADNLYNLAQSQGLSIRQLYQHAASANSQRFLIGTPESIADDLQHWVENGAADGFNICPAAMPSGLDDFVELLLPELRRRDLVRTEYAQATLRGNFGLSAPETGDIRARDYLASAPEPEKVPG